MINFKYITLQNFMSFGAQPTTFDLSKEGSTLILGNNEDVGESGNSRNGVGKSSSFQAIIFALYGKGVDKLKADEFINIKNEKKLVVELGFEKDGKQYKVIRKRKPNALELFVDNQQVTLDTMANTDRMIESIVGTYDIFMTSFLLTPHRDSFLAMSSTDQRALIEEMLSLDVLAERAEALKLIRKELEVDCKIIERDITNANQQNANTAANVERMQVKLTKEQEAVGVEIERVQNQLKDLESIDMDALAQEFAHNQLNLQLIQQHNQTKTKLQLQLASLESDWTSLGHTINTLTKVLNDIKTLQPKADSYADELKSLEDDISNKAASLNLSGDLTVGLLTEQKNILTETQQTLKELSDIMQELDADRGKIAAVVDRIDRVSPDIERIAHEIEHLQQGKCPTCNQDYCDHSKIEAQETKLNKLKQTVKKDEAELQQLQADLTARETELNTFLEEIDLPGIDYKGIQKELRTIDLNIRNITDVVTDLRLLESKKTSNPYQMQLDKILKDHPDVNAELGVAGSARNVTADQIAGLKDEIALIVGDIGSLELKKFPLLDQYNVANQTDIDNLTSKIANLHARVAELQTMDHSFLINEIDTLKSQYIDVDKISGELKEIQTQIEHTNMLIKLLTNNTSFIRKGIVDKFIPFINKRIYEYTEALGLMHLVTVNNDLSSEVLYMNRTVSYYNLSQGERLRVNLAMSLAFRDLMASLGKQSNILLIDEFLDAGGDTTFVNKAIQLVTKKAKHVDIISHRTDIVDFVDNTLTIVKRNGFSFVEGV